MAREYTIPFSNITVAGVTTLCCLMPEATSAIEILQMWAGLKSGSAGAMEVIETYAMVPALPTTAVPATPVKTKEGDPISKIVGAATIAAGKCGVNIGTETGTKSGNKRYTFHTFNGWLWQPATPYDTLILSPGSANAFGFGFPVAPTTAAGWSGGLTYREIG